ncbi:hypothetical protein GTQ40_05165 [Flavobacteriaceae bacterium R38]|nr:hypothetical protein [Flavobacteriaceae bacterium R38]
MKAKLINQKSKALIGELKLMFLPRENEWIEFNNKIYSVYRIVHTEDGIRIRVVDAR